MAIPVMQFQPNDLSKSLFAGMQAGESAMTSEAQRQSLQQQIQSEALRQKLTEQFGAHEEAAKLAQTQAQTGLIGAQTTAIPITTQAKLAALQQTRSQDLSKDPIALGLRIRQMYNANPNDPTLPLYVSQYKNLMQSKRGISIGTSPSGGMQVQIGGSGPSGMAEMGVEQQVPGQGSVAVPTTGASRGQMGKTFYDPATGQITSTPTQQVTTQLQKGALAMPVIQKSVDEIKQKVGPFIGALGKGKLAIAKPLGFLGMGTAGQEVSQYAQGSALLKTIPEQLLPMMNLQATDENVKRLDSIFRPKFGETHKSYNARVDRQWTEFRDRVIRGKRALTTGVKLGQSPTVTTSQKLPPKSYLDVINPKYSTKTIPNPNYRTQVSTTAQAQYSDEDLIHTAKIHGLTVDQVKKRLGVS